MEKVRLVIWDLDETFWKGTLTEGGHTYWPLAHDTVIELARRGIMSSICSKNEPSQVEAILRAQGIWDYFIFPSVNWLSKGQRVAEIVRDTQLRPETVLFIDDSHLNRAEVQYYCPNIQVADESLVGGLLSDSRLQGKDDRDLSRLRQYIVLQAKKRDAAAHSGSNKDFLEASQIRVYIEHFVEAHLDRAIELINRTNQLNFTKERLPEDSASAKSLVQAELASYDTVAGLVFAADKYGDYGCVGLYVMLNREGLGRKLSHFCFLCRTLGMDIETWLYNRLGRPKLVVKGEVLTDVLRDDPEISWIREVSSIEDLRAQVSDPSRLDTLVVRGGCDVRAIEHYFSSLFENSFEEMNDIVDGVDVRTDHSVFLKLALDGVTPAMLHAVAPLHFLPQHYKTRITSLPKGRKNVLLLSFWSDGRLPLFRHKETGVEVPFWQANLPNTPLQIHLDDPLLNIPEKVRAMLAHLQRDFHAVGPLDIQSYRKTLDQLATTVGDDTLVIFVLSPIFWFKRGSDESWQLQREPALNDVSVSFRDAHPNTIVIDPHQFAKGREAYESFFHFTREVYRDIGLHLRAEIEAFAAREKCDTPSRDVNFMKQ